MKSQTIASRGINRDIIEFIGGGLDGGVLVKVLLVHLGGKSSLDQELVKNIKNGSLVNMNLIWIHH